MAGATDKTRFYLEQSVPELLELERKNIFSTEEISSIAKKRASFEHRINSRNSKPIDYARYVEFELNLDSLRRKRVSRNGIKFKNHAGQRRISFIMDRATRKFPGDLRLWMQSMEVARQQKAFKKVSQILTSLVRLHPTKSEVWIHAANYAFFDQADMTEARSYMQRGLRFCKHSEGVWLAYLKIELLYIEKIAARHKILKLDQYTQDHYSKSTSNSNNDDFLALPTTTVENTTPDLRIVDIPDKTKSEAFDEMPALAGDIPATILIAAIDEFPDENSRTRFFDMLRDFGHLSCSDALVEKLVVHLLQTPKSAAGQDAYIRQPLIGVPVLTAEFPRRLGISLKRLEASFADCPSLCLVHKTVDWIATHLRVELDVDVRTVLEITLSEVVCRYQSLYKEAKKPSAEEIAVFVEQIDISDMKDTVMDLLAWALEIWPANSRLLVLQGSITKEDRLIQ